MFQSVFLGARTLNNKCCDLVFRTSRCSFSTKNPVQSSNSTGLSIALVKKINSLLNEKNVRCKQGKTVLKNLCSVQSAVACGVNISDIIYKNTSSLKKLPSNMPENVRLHQVHTLPMALEIKVDSESDFMIGMCDIPGPDDHETEYPGAGEDSPVLPLNIILDNMRNYENVGVVIRLFHSLRCKSLLLTSGCIDIWNPKTIECSMGSIFKCHRRIKTSQSWTEISESTSKDSHVLMAEAFKSNSEKRGKKLDSFVKYTDFDYKSNDEFTLIIGGETEGLSEGAEEFCLENYGSRIYIPLQEDVDSLNGGVATAVVLSEIFRQIHCGRSQ